MPGKQQCGWKPRREGLGFRKHKLYFAVVFAVDVSVKTGDFLYQRPGASHRGFWPIWQTDLPRT